MFLSSSDFWRYLDKAYNSVPGSGGFNPLHAIPCVHGLTETTNIFSRGVYRLHGLPRVLISDRDPRFVSFYGKNFEDDWVLSSTCRRVAILKLMVEHEVKSTFQK
jgi:hypothetical protein